MDNTKELYNKVMSGTSPEQRKALLDAMTPEEVHAIYEMELENRRNPQTAETEIPERHPDTDIEDIAKNLTYDEFIYYIQHGNSTARAMLCRFRQLRPSDYAKFNRMMHSEYHKQRKSQLVKV